MLILCCIAYSAVKRIELIVPSPPSATIITSVFNLFIKSASKNFSPFSSLKGQVIPLLVGEVVNADMGGVCAAHNEVIAKVPSVIPQAHVISSAGCTVAFDNLHFDAAGYRELGRRYADVMLQLLGYEMQK